MSVVLITPPIFKACEPLLGIATLKAWLQLHDVECHCIDANVEAQDWLLTTERVEAAWQTVSERPDLPSRVQSVVRSWPSLRHRLDAIKQSLRTPYGYADQNRHRTAVTSLNRAVGLVSAAQDPDQGHPVVASLTDYLDSRRCDMESASIAAAAAAPEQNLFFEYYRDVLIPRLHTLKPTVIGLSFIFRNQLLCGVVLARMLKDAFPEAHVTLGGELVSAWVETLEHTQLMGIADSIIPYEGEYPLLELARGKALSEVPNICYRDAAGVVHKNATRKPDSLAQVPAPSYDWVPWDLYFAPERTAALVTARGCYWNRCTFCPEVVNPETKLRLARVERLCQDMDALHEEQGVTMFHFIDSAIPPRTLKGVAEYIRDNDRPYRWYGFSRLEHHLFRDGFAETLYDGGCRMLKLGLETASQRLLDVMDKKQDVGDVSRILHALHDARILVHGFIMFGTPYEEEADAEQTRAFVAEHAHAVQFLNCSIMNLAKGSPMALDPPAHGITEVCKFEIPGRQLDLALYDNFECEGWGRVGARHFLQRVFLKDSQVRPSYLRTPAHFDSNHSVFFHRLVFTEGFTEDKTAPRLRAAAGR